MRTLTLDARMDLPNVVVTVGTFDGVHLGHRAVLDTVKLQARSRAGTAVVVTFDPHPRAVIHPDRAPGVLTCLPEKAWRIAPAGIDILAVVRFTESVRALSPNAFVEKYLVHLLGAQAVVVGYDHGFGRNRSGGLDEVQALGKVYGFDVLSVDPMRSGGQPVSSTRIRQAVEAGNLAEAIPLLGGGYPISGRVVRGDGRGRDLGFPTANLHLQETGKLLPPNGVYAAWAHLSKAYKAVLNLGVCPTFTGKSRTLEAHIPGFSGNLYGEVVTLELMHRIREERRFQTSDALVAQIRRDKETAECVLSQTDVTLLRR